MILLLWPTWAKKRLVATTTIHATTATGKGLSSATIHSTNERNCHRQIYDLCPICRGLPRRILLFIHKYSATHDPPRLRINMPFCCTPPSAAVRVKNHTRKRPTPSQKNLSQPVNGGGLNGHIESALSIWIQLINATQQQHKSGLR